MPTLAFAPLAPPPPDGVSDFEIIGLVVVVLVFGFLAWFYWRKAEGRQGIFETFARQRGWEFRAEGDDVTAEPYARLPLFYKGSQLKLRPLVEKRDTGKRVQMGDFAFMSGTSLVLNLPVMILGARWHQTVALAQSRHRSLPLLVVAPNKRGVLAPYAGQNLQRLTFPDQKGGDIFGKKAVLLSRKPELVKELLAGDKLADFVETIVEPLLESRLALEAGGSWIAVYESNGLAPPEELPWLWEFAEKTAAYFVPGR